MDIGTAARYELMELSQDQSIHPLDKYVYCHFWRRYYENWGYIYQVDIIQHQAQFIEQLKQFETYYFSTSMAEFSDTQTPSKEPPVLSDIWNRGERVLEVISNELYDAGYIEDPMDFKMAFYTNTNSKCNWIGTNTSLLYLLTIALHRHIKNVPKTVRDLSASRFLINGKEKSQEITRTISAKVKPHLVKDKTELNADYRKIFLILEKSLQ
ncbi:hypothetical protein GCM10023093_10490 [Nemorincola caseinilytica]|uniref:Uncharacterized protein n=1 Tax=Nemorincola caseinilytica TaxID=2054315 RepID=A0ABP8N870_9BACT